MKKRIFLSLISLVLLVSMLISCGGNSSTQSSSETTETREETSKETSEDTNASSETNTENQTENNGEQNKDEISLDAYYIIEAAAQNGRNGIANGWTYDNRFDLTNNTGFDNSTVFDTSDEKFYRMIRDFDAENDGVLKLEMIINAQSSNEGIYIGLCDSDDNILFRLTPKSGKWAFVGETEVLTNVTIESSAATSKFGIEMIIDLNNDMAEVTINNVNCGKINIPDKAISRLILGTNKKGTGTLGFEYVRLMKNYPVVDRFILGDTEAYEGKAPANWDSKGFLLDRIASMRLYDMYSVKAETKTGEKATATKSFEKTEGLVSFEAMILLPEKTNGAKVALMNGNSEIITFVTKDEKIYVGDNMVNDYIPNVWQTLHVDANTETGKADIYVNGKKRATVDFNAEYFDGINIEFAPDKDAVMWFDDVELYRIIEHSDYPSQPKVAESTDYNIGMNVCWLWRDQQSGEGWDATSPFSEFDPYLGFYDEGLRETADWELKWMAEHGIDFIHACWYCPSANIQAPIKEMRHSYAALHDGYMMAKYSDLVDFCIMWENNNKDCTSFEQFKEYIWSYWVEYYFSDERYARLDNKAVLTIWSRSNFVESMGGEDGAQKAVKFMNSELKKMGYDGIIILASTQGANNSATYTTLKNIGYDGTYGYHWGANGKDADYQISCNNTNVAASSGILHHIPTVSIGFNDVGRNETRDPIVSVEGHYKVCEDIKKILSKFDTGTWKDNTLFISTWNEYSEGTYLFPTESTGFDYLENIRKAFTNDQSDHSDLDVRPTKEQIERVTHLYPDNHSPIRWYQFEKADTKKSEYTISVNGNTLSFTFNPTKTSDGDFEVVGEARKKGFYSALRLYHEWDRFTGDGVLTLYTFDERKLIFRVGSDKVEIDGKEQSLGYTFKLRDGLPVFHLKKLCDILGYKYTEAQNSISIQAATDEEFASLKNNIENQWEFNIPGEGQGWRAQNGKIEVTDNGTLYFMPSGADVAVLHDVSFSYSKYTVIKMGVKYNPQVTSQSASLFFITESSKTYTADKCITARYDTSGKKEGDTVEVVFILSDNVNFVGNIVGIRIDPYTGLNPFEIDYIRCEYDEKYAFESDIIEVDDENQWFFDNNDKEGWTVGNAKFKGIVDGCFTAVGTNGDPAAHHSVDFPASRYQVLIIGVKYSEVFETAKPRLYFKTVANNSWNETQGINGTIRTADDTQYGDTVNIVFDLSSCDAWTGDVTAIRFDPFGIAKEFQIDYVRFCKKKSEQGEGVKPTKPTGAVITDPEKLPTGITVGTESTGKLSIVADPTDTSKKVFKIECIDSAKEKYTYFNLFMQFEAGKAYTVKYKIMPLTDMNGDPFSGTIIGGNMMYGTVNNPTISNHTFDSASNKGTTDKWIEITATVNIPANYTAAEKDHFQIWGKFSPTSKAGIDYLVKDISITPNN